MFLFSPMRATCSSYLIILDFIILILFNQECMLGRLWLCNLLCPPILHHFSLQIFCSTSCSQNTLSLYTSLNIRDKISHPYKSTGTIIVLHTLIFIIQTAGEKTKGLELNGSMHYPTVLPKYINFALFLTDLLALFKLCTLATSTYTAKSLPKMSLESDRC
jgi:hypothetical protein